MALGIFILGFLSVAMVHGGQTAQIVQIQEVSSSGGSIVINRGTEQDIQVGDLASFFKVVDLKSLKAQMVGKAKVIKTYPHRSFWYFEQIIGSQYLAKGEFLDILIQRETLRGRIVPKIQRHQRVLLPSQHAQELINDRQVQTSGKSPRIVKQDVDYNGIPTDNERATRGSGDIFDLAEWIEYDDDQGVFFARRLKTGPKVEQVLQSLREDQHQQIVQRFLNQESTVEDVVEEKLWKKMVTAIIAAILMLSPKGTWALDIDEKLTLRLLKLSQSKRTVLINRGIEDGLAVGDHAKFYLTTGMVARGVVVKVSPARSVWSVYRIIDPASLVAGKVLNLKIATAVKITPDPTKMVMVEPVAVPGVDIPVSPDAQAFEQAAAAGIQGPKAQNDSDIESEFGTDEGNSGDKQIEQVASGLTPSQFLPTTSTTKGPIWEVTAQGHFNSLSSKLDSDDPSSRNSGPQGSYDLNLGLENYFALPGQKFQNLSLQAFLSMGKSDAMTAHEGGHLASSFLGFGLAVNYHFYHHPQEMRKPIAFASFGLGAGRSRDDSFRYPNEELVGDAFFYHFGAGVKYYIGRWGGKLQLDYYTRREKYLVEYTDPNGLQNLEDKRTKTLSGPRIALGILYRF